ncbi:hypothetical protein NU195Hw_g8780t1 [Hortaea werneckii]
MPPPKTPPAEELAKHNLRQVMAGSHNAKERCERLRNLEYRDYRKFDKNYNKSSERCLEILGFLVTYNWQVYDYTGCKPVSYRPSQYIDVWMSPNLHIPLTNLLRGHIGSKLLADLLDIPEDEFWNWVEELGGDCNRMELHEFAFDPSKHSPTVIHRHTGYTFEVPNSDLIRMQDILLKDRFGAAQGWEGIKQRLRRLFGKRRC